MKTKEETIMQRIQRIMTSNLTTKEILREFKKIRKEKKEKKTCKRS